MIPKSSVRLWSKETTASVRSVANDVTRMINDGEASDRTNQRLTTVARCQKAERIRGTMFNVLAVCVIQIKGICFMDNWNRRVSGHGGQLEKNRKRIYATQTICGICGRPVDFSLKYPHPLSPTIDHIIPISKGGHPSDINNLQLAHRCCNRQKADKLVERKTEDKAATLSPRVLPQTFEWTERPLRAIGKIN